MGYRSMLEKKQPDASHNEYFHQITAAAKRIAAMVQFTKEYKEIGVPAPKWQECRTVLDTAAKKAPLGKVTVNNDLPEGIEMFADPLIIKVFSPSGGQCVSVREEDHGIRFSALERDGDLIIMHEDDGDGVVVRGKEKIFERGFGKNTGLGLALSREILDITGITIKETGKLDKGARFGMTVPKGAWRMAGECRE